MRARELPDPSRIVEQLQHWSAELGFSSLAVSRIKLGRDDELMQRWLDQGKHGSMQYLTRNRELRRDPRQLHPGTLSVICLTLPYWPKAADARKTLKDSGRAYVSRYALGRDYHKVARGRMRTLARQLSEQIGPFGYRAFADSAPMLEKALARDASLGWIGKNTLLINAEQGSYFFLGELLTDLPLPPSTLPPAQNQCGECQACIRSCPTGAIEPDGSLDARRCISYLTIERKGPIPDTMRPAIGNRIFGCDDCQLVCPWNRQPAHARVDDFDVRHQLDQASLLTLFNWDEPTFLERTEGMAIRRTGYLGWQRNLIIALGNGPKDERAIQALLARRRESDGPDWLIEHIDWALGRLSA